MPTARASLAGVLRSLYQDRLLPHLLAATQATLIILLAVLKQAPSTEESEVPIFVVRDEGRFTS